MEQIQAVKSSRRSLYKNWEFKLAIFLIGYFLITNGIFSNTSYMLLLLLLRPLLLQKGLGRHLKVIPEEIIDYYDQKTTLQNTEKLAYMQYATNYEYLNLAILNFVQLRKAQTQIPNLVILYDEILQFYDSDRWSDLFQVANYHGITMRPTLLIKSNYDDQLPWAASFTKLQVFAQDDFDRIVYIDADSMFVNASFVAGGKAINEMNGVSHIDELFKIPQEFDVALPQAYWLNHIVEGKSPPKYTQPVIEIPTKRTHKLQMRKLVNELNKSQDWRILPLLVYEDHKFENFNDFFANHVMVIKPSKDVYNELLKFVFNPWYWSLTNRKNVKKSSDYDMEILNKYLDTKLRKGAINVGILPHRVYGVLTGEFGEEWHARFITEPQYLPFVKKRSNKGWDPVSIFSKVKLVHFSDSPIPKPWEEERENANQEPQGGKYYDTKRTFCKTSNLTEYHEKFPHFKPRLVEDCVSVDIWNWIRKKFKESQKDLWFC